MHQLFTVTDRNAWCIIRSILADIRIRAHHSEESLPLGTFGEGKKQKASLGYHLYLQLQSNE